MQSWQIQKHEVRSNGGIVVAQHREAAAAGAAVLAKGGTSMDAAIVTALVLSVVEPWLSGIGGGGFLLHADPASGTVDALDFNVMSPAGVAQKDYPPAPGKDGDWFDWPSVVEDKNLIGYSSICIPGAIAGFAEALARHGSISWAEALAPAIAFAERGLEVDWYASLSIAIDGAGLARYPASSAIFLEDGRAPRTAEKGNSIFRPMPKKAALLRRLAESGARDFYEGAVARTLVGDLQAGGSTISLDDLAAYKPVWCKPLEGSFAGKRIQVMPGLSGGPALLDCLARLGDLPADPHSGAMALKFAQGIRGAYEYRLTKVGHAGTTDPGCTSHISVVDSAGRMVSLTNTLLSRFGSKVVLPEAGILMNNGMMWFDPRPGQPNSIKGRVKPLANMCPVIVQEADGTPSLAIGAAGGRQIFPAIAQLLTYHLHYGLSLEQAFHTPRIDASTPVIRINRAAASDVASKVASEFAVELIDDTLYPVNFAVPSAVTAASGMAHPTNPWAAAVSSDG